MKEEENLIFLKKMTDDSFRIWEEFKNARDQRRTLHDFEGVFHHTKDMLEITEKMLECLKELVIVSEKMLEKKKKEAKN